MNAPVLVTLFGKMEIDTALLCLKSLIKHSKEKFNLTVLDDGTLTDNDVTKVKANLEGSSVILKKQRDELIADKLKSYPACIKFRSANILSQKLFDCALIHEEPIINYIDSDILFLRDFSGFPLAGSKEEYAVFMADIQSAYALKPLELFRNPQLNIPQAINTGLISFPRNSYNLKELDGFLAEHLMKPSFIKSGCWAEQTCWAYLAGKIDCRLWDPKQLLIAGPHLNKDRISAVGIHFVSSYRNQLNNFKGAAELSRQTEVLKSFPSKRLNFLKYSIQRLIAKIKG